MNMCAVEGVASVMGTRATAILQFSQRADQSVG